MLRYLYTIVVVLTLAACAPIRITPPEVELAGIEVRDASITHLNLNANIRIFNPNRDTIRVGAVSYSMELNGEKIFSSVTYVDEPVGPMESIVVPLRISSAFWDIIAFFSRLGTYHALDFRLSGSVEAGPSHGRMASFDFERTGKIDLANGHLVPPGVLAPPHHNGPSPLQDGRSSPHPPDDYI